MARPTLSVQYCTREASHSAPAGIGPQKSRLITISSASSAWRHEPVGAPARRRAALGQGRGTSSAPFPDGGRRTARRCRWDRCARPKGTASDLRGGRSAGLAARDLLPGAAAAHARGLLADDVGARAGAASSRILTRIQPASPVARQARTPPCSLWPSSDEGQVPVALARAASNVPSSQMITAPLPRVAPRARPRSPGRQAVVLRPARPAA